MKIKEYFTNEELLKIWACFSRYNLNGDVLDTIWCTGGFPATLDFMNRTIGGYGNPVPYKVIGFYIPKNRKLRVVIRYLY